MTENEKAKIQYLRSEGYSYKMISSKLGISLNTVTSHCRRNGMAGVAQKTRSLVCRNCGKELPISTLGKKRKFCSDLCRNQWWKEHPQLVSRTVCYEKTCMHCGNRFVVYRHPEQKYCSHSCFISHRFSKPKAEGKGE